MREERHSINVEGEKIALVLHYAGEGEWPCVVACHGLGASKDSEKYLLLGREFPNAGFSLCRFDFRGCGESGGRYEESTVSGRLLDLRVVLAFLRDHPAARRGVSLLGSSLGGFIALYGAVREPDVRSVVTWNSPATLRGLKRDAGGDVAGLGRGFFEEINRGELADAPRGVQRCLVIQGDRDEVVPPDHGRSLYELAVEPRRLHMIRGGDHRLTEMAHRMEALTESLSWIGLHHDESAA